MFVYFEAGADEIISAIFNEIETNNLRKVHGGTMANEEMNRYCHEVILGKCWHEGVTDAVFEMGVGALDVPYWCPKCKHAVNPPDEDGLFNPDYCSDDSPRRLLNEVVDKVIDIYVASSNMGGLPDHFYLSQRTPAERIAQACVDAHRESVAEST